MSSLQMFQKHGAGYSKTKQSSAATVSTASLSEVCSSTASMSVSSRPYDSPTVVSFSSSSAANNSEQFEDADEFQPLKAPQRVSSSCNSNPLNALAMAACASPAAKTTTGFAATSVSNVGGSRSGLDNDISDNDVLCGRGGLTNHHPGNVRFRRLVHMKQEAYLKATKKNKAGVAKEIVDCIRRQNGRFLKKDPSNVGKWIDIGNQKAREKTSQALREGAPELREELHSEGQGNKGLPSTSWAIGMTLQQQQQSRLKQQPHVAKLEMMNNPAYTMQHQQQQHSSTMFVPQQRPIVPTTRIVSSDSNFGGVRPLFHTVATATTTPTQNNKNGPHLIADEQPSHQVYLSSPPPPQQQQSYRHPQPMDVDHGMKRKSDVSNKRGGPRLKLLKQRLAREDDGDC